MRKKRKPRHRKPNNKRSPNKAYPKQRNKERRKYQLPIYQEARSIDLKKFNNSNKGLIFNKWTKQWFEEEEQSKSKKAQKPNDDPKLLEFDKPAFVKNWSGAEKEKKEDTQDIGSQVLIDDYCDRIQKLVTQINGITFEMKTLDRVVTGMGLPHPLENGLIWHHTLGVPFLLGSSIKGMLRSWLETWKSVEPKVIDSIFGKEDSARQVGNCLFFDAIPTESVKLEADVMTPHFQEYYSGKKSEDEKETKDEKELRKEKKEKKETAEKEPVYPHEHSDPIPIPFLTIAPGQRFLFAIAPRNKKSSIDLNQIRSWLEEAMQTVGFGAKTAVGYGRFQKINGEYS